MTTVTNTVAAKLFGALAVVALVLSMVAPVAQAQTSEDDLQQMINDLLAQVGSLQSQLGQGSGSVAAGVCPYTWTRDLNTGATGADVMMLQQFLNADPDTRVAAAGSVGSAGMETEYYGPATAAAVSKFQVANRSTVLSPAGLVNPTGYFGPSSRAAANAQCVSAPVMDDTSDDDTSDDVSDDDVSDDDDDDSSDGPLSGGEADVNSFDFSDEEDEVEEGEEDVAVLNIEFDVEDGDVRLERVDVTFDGTGLGSGAEDEPWDVFEEISLWVDGEKIASEDASDEDDWDENSGDEFEFRLTNVDADFREDTTGEILVAVSVQGGVDVDGGGGSADEWDIFVDSNGLRFVDSLGLDITEPSSAGTASMFDILEAGDGDDLDLESADDDPDASTLPVDEDDETEHLVFAFDLSADDSDGDVELDNFISVDVAVGGTDGTSLDAFIDDFRLEIGGESFDAESYTGSNATATIDFDIDGDVVVDEDTTASALLYANFDDVANTFDNATISASVATAQVDAEGEVSGENITVGGSTKTGNVHTLRLTGLTLAGEPSDGDDEGDASAAVVDPIGSSDGTFYLEFEITAFGDDLWVRADNPVRNASSTAGLAYEIETSNGASVASAGTSSVSYDIQGADEDNGFFELEEGESYTMVVTVDSYNPAAEGSFQFQLLSIGFSDTEDTAADSTATPDDPTEYRSDAVNIKS